MVLDTVARRIRRDGANPTIKRDSWWPSSLTPWSSNGKVNDAAALSQPAFYRGVTLIAQTIAGLPMQVFEEVIESDGTEGPTKKLKSEDTAYLWRRPNIEMTRQSMWERVIADEVRGNGYVWVDKDDNGGVAGIWWLARNRVRPGRTSSGQKVYEVDGELPMIDYKQGGEIVHFPNWGDSISGYDPVQIAAKAIALGISAEEYASAFFAGGGVPSGILSTDQVLTQPQADKVLENWLKRVKSNRPAVLGAGVQYQAIALDAEKAQMQQMRSFSVQDTARLLGLPPHLLGDVDHASQGGGNGVEEQNRGVYIYNFSSHVNRLEQGISDDLLVRELTNRYIKFKPDSFLRGNTLARFEAYRRADFMTPNEKRALEDMEPIEGGDVLLQPLNLAPIEDLGIEENARPSRPTGR
jgi:HK97 family phage portal protein